MHDRVFYTCFCQFAVMPPVTCRTDLGEALEGQLALGLRGAEAGAHLGELVHVDAAVPCQAQRGHVRRVAWMHAGDYAVVSGRYQRNIGKRTSPYTIKILSCISSRVLHKVEGRC